MKNKTGQIKRAVLIKNGNKPAIDKLADFCESHALLASDSQLSISFESYFVDDHATMAAAFQKQISKDLGSLTELLPTLYELYTQLVAEANEHETDHSSQTDSSKRLHASLKRHPE